MPDAKLPLTGIKVMDTKASTLAITIVILLLLAGNGQATHSYPKVGNNFTSKVRLEYCDLLSKWDIVILHRNVRVGQPEIISSLRTLNPDIELLTYFPCGAVWADYDTMDAPAFAFGDKVESCDWWLRDTKGNRVGDPTSSYFVNISDKCPAGPHGETVQEWLAEHIANEVILGGPWDGILLDILFDDPYWLNVQDFFEDPPAMIDINRDGVADSPDSAHAWWRAGVISFLDILRDRVGQSCILVGNGKHCLSDQLNGGIRENFPKMHGGWTENMFSSYGYMTQCREMVNYEVSCPMILSFWEREGNTLFEPERGPSYERFVRFTLCSALLGDGYYLLYDGSRSLWWESYYDLDLGMPTSDAYRDSLWNLMYHRFSPVWRRDFENGTVYCNPYQEYISFDGGWLSPEDALIKMYGVPSSVAVEIVSEGTPARSFDRSDRQIAYRAVISNSSENAVFASVWAELSKGGTTYATSSQIEFLVGAQDTTIKDRMLRIPPNLSLGTYCLKVMVGGPEFAEVDSDTIMLTKTIGFDEEQFKHEDGGAPSTVSIYPQPAVSSGGHLVVEVNPGAHAGRMCSIRLYDVTGRLVTRAFGENLDGILNLDIDLTGAGGLPLAPGVYFLSVELADQAVTRKVVLLRR
jgi:hypothetical protein